MEPTRFERVLVAVFRHPLRSLALAGGGVLLVVVLASALIGGGQPGVRLPDGSIPHESKETEAAEQSSTPSTTPEDSIPGSPAHLPAGSGPPPKLLPHPVDIPEEPNFPAQVVKPNFDPYDSDAELRAQAHEDVTSHLALQHIPYTANGIHADLTDRAPDGRIVITVSYTGSRPAAEKAWRSFLGRYHDDGSSYFVIYQPGE